MIIACPECSVKFMVETEAFGEKSRKVRCGKCTHVWQQEPPSTEDVSTVRQVRIEQTENLAKAVADKKAGVKPNLPALRGAGKIRKALKVACWLLFIFNVFAFILYNKDVVGQTAFYDMIGDYDSRGVEIADVKFTEPLVTKDKIVYYFDWDVQNTRQAPMKVPHVKLALLDADKELIYATEPTETPEMLTKDGEFIFRSNKLIDESKKGRYVVIDIGNPYEITTRD